MTVTIAREKPRADPGRTCVKRNDRQADDDDFAGEKAVEPKRDQGADIEGGDRADDVGPLALRRPHAGQSDHRRWWPADAGGTLHEPRRRAGAQQYGPARAAGEPPAAMQHDHHGKNEAGGRHLHDCRIDRHQYPRADWGGNETRQTERDDKGPFGEANSVRQQLNHRWQAAEDHDRNGGKRAE